MSHYSYQGNSCVLFFYFFFLQHQLKLWKLQNTGGSLNLPFMEVPEVAESSSMCTNTVVPLYKETLKFTPDVHMAGKDYLVKEG